MLDTRNSCAVITTTASNYAAEIGETEMRNLNDVKKAAKKAGKSVVYNRSTGMYQIKSGAFSFSDGVIPCRNESKKLDLLEVDAKLLASYI